MLIGSDLAGETMMRKLSCLVVFVFAFGFAGSLARGAETTTTKPEIIVNHRGLVKLGWQLAAVGTPFNDRGTLDMVDLLHSLGVHHIELSAEQAKRLDASGIDALLGKLKSVKLDVVSFGPVDLGSTETEARSNFQFAKKFNMKTIVAYPDDGSLEMLDKLANEFKVNIAIRNQPKPTGHWDPDDLLKALDGRSARVGVCIDVAAWRASGLSPAECAKKLKGHILEVHLTSFANSDSAQVLKELKDQKFKGICAIEAAGGGDVVTDFAHEVTAFSKVVGELSGLQ